MTTIIALTVSQIIDWVPWNYPISLCYYYQYTATPLAILLLSLIISIGLFIANYLFKKKKFSLLVTAILIVISVILVFLLGLLVPIFLPSFFGERIIHGCSSLTIPEYALSKNYRLSALALSTVLICLLYISFSYFKKLRN